MEPVDEKAPHRAVILVRAEIMQVRHDGYVTGAPVRVSSKVYVVDGNSKEKCTTNLEKFLDKVDEDAK